MRRAEVARRSKDRSVLPTISYASLVDASLQHSQHMTSKIFILSSLTRYMTFGVGGRG